MFEGRPPKSVNMHFRRFRIANIPIKNDKSFEVWLRNRWREKDYLLEHFARFNRFPEDDLWMQKQRKAGRSQLIAQPAKTIETQIQSNNLEEFLSIFAPLTSVLMVVFLMSGGANPNDLMQMITDASKGSKNALSGLSNLLGGASDVQKQLADKVSVPDMATMSQIGRLTPATAQKELIQKYLNSVTPMPGRPLSLPDPNASQRRIMASKNKAPSIRSQPAGTARTMPDRKISLNTNASSVSAPTSRQVGESKLRTVQTAAPGEKQKANPNAKIIGRMPGTQVNKANQPAKKTAPGPATTKAPISKAINGTKTEATKPAQPSQPRKVTVTPAMLAKMKANAKPSPPKKVTVDPKVLARMKSQQKSS